MSWDPRLLLESCRAPWERARVWKFVRMYVPVLLQIDRLGEALTAQVAHMILHLFVVRIDVPLDASLVVELMLTTGHCAWVCFSPLVTRLPVGRWANLLIFSDRKINDGVHFK